MLTGGAGVDDLTGGGGFDTFVFAAGNSGQIAGWDIIRDYGTGLFGSGDVIDYSAGLTIGGSAATANSSQASINQTTGVATFARSSGGTLADALADISARFTAAANSAGEFALFRVKETGNFYLFISDGVAGLTPTDVVVELIGVTTVTGVDLTDGNLTILGGR